MSRPVAIVTGASQGIGRAIARHLVAEGYHVALGARHAAPLEELARELGEAIAVPTDVTTPSDVTRLVATTLERWGRVDLLVNNAGTAHVASVEETTLDDFDRVMAVNVRGAFLCTRAVLPIMRNISTGHIINVMSVAAKRAFPNWGAYCASKFALDGLMRALAEELKGTGIRVTALYPGATDTDLWDEIGLGDVGRGGMVRPEDVAAAVAFAVAQPARARVAEIVIEPAAGDV
jgi:NADP-dependent 3-hydroxy acid dehydrogenase YdfG